jgi:1-acyl-sn-glycerol-3-phosphate acyltransferase
MQNMSTVSFSLLPEAEYYPNPRLSWLIEVGFDLTVRALYRVERVLQPGCRPGTLVVSNHQRESDVPIVCAALCRRRGLRILDPLPFFAMREDLLHRDALFNLLAKSPRPVARTLGKIPLRWLFHGVRTMPMRRLREFTLGDTIEALIEAGLGDAEAESVLNARGQREVVARMQRLPGHVREISRDAMGKAWRTYWGLRRLRLSAFRRIEPDFRRTINTQLDNFAALLDSGRSLYMAPEGTISPTGYFGRVRAGPWQVSRRRATPALVMPVGLSYDALGPGRLRVVVHGGAPLRHPDLSNQCRFGADLREMLLALCVLTPSHLLAWYLHHGPPCFTTAKLAGWLERGRDAAHAAGVGLDPIWKRSSGAMIARERIAWMRRKRLIAPAGDDIWRNIWPRDSAPGWDTPAAMVTYFVNSLTDFAPGFAQSVEL